MAAKCNVIFLTGAPTFSEVNSPEAWLLDDFVPAVTRFVEDISVDDLPTPAPSHTWPSWRTLQIEKDGVESQANDHRYDEAWHGSFPVPTGTLEESNLNFLEHSLAVFTGSPLPHTEPASDPSFEDTTSVQASFLGEISNDGSFFTPLDSRMATRPSSVTDLRDLPNALSLDKSYPQTITVDLIVGLISVAPSRVVPVRRGSRFMEIIELTVGDDTRTGFTVTFWLNPGDDSAINLRTMLESLRGRQILLMTNVALCAWQGRVYGQSLNRHVSKNETTIERLDSYRRAGVDHSKTVQLPNNLHEKLEKVEAWVINFLYSADQSRLQPTNAKKRTVGAARSRSTLEQSELPPDTQ